MTMISHYFTVQWAHGARKTPDDFPTREESWASIADVARDILSGEVESVARVVEIDLDAGVARDVTDAAFSAAAELSFDRESEPYAELAREFDRRRLDYCREAADPYWTRVDEAYERARDARMEGWL